MGGRFYSAVEGDLIAASERIRQARYLRRLACAGLLFCADLLAFAAVAVLIRSGHQVPKITLYNMPFFDGARVDLFLVLSVAFVAIRYIAGDYTRRQMFWDGVRVTTVSLMVVSLPSIFLIFLSRQHYSLGTVLVSWLVLIPLVQLFRHAARSVLRRFGLWQLPTALIGDGARIDKVNTIFDDSESLGFNVKYLIRNDGATCETETRRDVVNIDLKNSTNIVRRLCQAECLEAVIVTDEGQNKGEINALIDHLSAAGIGVAIVPQPQNFPMIGIKINYTFDQNMLLLHVDSDLRHFPGRLLKWTIDFFGSIALLAIILPFFAIIAVLIKRADGGKVFFVQPRVGRGGREFGCIKFRTMRADAEETLARWKRENSPLYREYVKSNFKLRNDPRVTKVGRMLRRTSLDELPQLLNVLMGSMSLVGPRPLLAREICEYGDAFSLYKSVRPGMSGLWQVSGRSHTTFADRAAADTWYVKNWSMWYDVVILFKTVSVLIKKEGAY